MVSLNPTVGHEQQGMRPVLVVSADEYNRASRLPLVVPITSGGAFARNAGFAVSLAGTGTRTTGVVLCNQVRALDVLARQGRRVESAPESLVQEVLARLMALLE